MTKTQVQNYWRQSWELYAEVCPCDVDFIDRLRQGNVRGKCSPRVAAIADDAIGSGQMVPLGRHGRLTIYRAGPAR